MSKLIGSVSVVRPITNIGQLMEALTVGWSEVSGSNRRIMAGDGGQFVRVNPRAYEHCYFKPWRGDIPIESGGYSMRGFVQFEALDQFRGLFKVDRAPDRVWHSAELTADGYRLACAGLLDFTPIGHAFFQPHAVDVERDRELPAPAFTNPNKEAP